jgi:hypothetical protein
MSLDEWRMMADHMGGVEVMGGRATELVQLVQAPATPMTKTGEMHGDMPGMTPDSAGMVHDMEQMDHPMEGMAHDSMPPSRKTDTTRAPMAAHMSAMMVLHARMMADPVIRKRVMADSVMRRLMIQMMDSAGVAPLEPKGGAAERPGGRAKKHEDHEKPKREPSGRTRPRAKPPAPAPRPAKPESADTAPHREHSMGAAAVLRRAT